jgi:uncharacterized protein YgbK (DUF1537 family)
MRGMDLVVAADDRTGALEVAGRLADAGNGPVTVTAWPDVPTDLPTDVVDADGGAASTDRVVVVDLGTRHLSQREARYRATSLTCGARSAHKIDSALRGNWADELAGRAERCPVLLVPALPEFGRVCIGGEVLEHGRPVHEGAAGTDVRRRLASSHPSTLLRAAGAQTVEEIADVEQVRTWLAAPSGVVVADAQDDDDIAAIVDAWQRAATEVVLAGPSAVVGRGIVGDAPIGRLQLGAGPVLVVCGSVHPAAREQLEFAERRGMPVTTLADDITARQLEEHGSLALVTEIPVGDVDEPMAVAAAASLARGVADLRDRVALAALVVIGGDTAAAVLGHRPALVHGTVVAGTAWATLGDDPLPVITRSGGFGSDAALDDLLRELPRA